MCDRILSNFCISSTQIYIYGHYRNQTVTINYYFYKLMWDRILSNFCISSTLEIDVICFLKLREAELMYQREQNELEVSKARSLAELEVQVPFTKIC